MPDYGIIDIVVNPFTPYEVEHDQVGVVQGAERARRPAQGLVEEHEVGERIGTDPPREERHHLAAALVEPKRLRRPLEARRAHVAEQGVHGGRPGTGRAGPCRRRARRASWRRR